jgi:hypothetical protein
VVTADEFVIVQPTARRPTGPLTSLHAGEKRTDSKETSRLIKSVVEKIKEISNSNAFNFSIFLIPIGRGQRNCNEYRLSL